MIQDLPILDFHCHFPVQGEWFPDYPDRKKVSFDTASSRDYGEIWRQAFNFPKPEEARTDEEMVALYLKDLDAKGIERVVWVSGGGNERLASILAMGGDRFIGFAHHNPDAKDAAMQLEHAFRDLGLSGYKLLTPEIETPIDDERYYPLWEVCQAYHVPVLLHFGLLGAAGGIATATNISPLRLSKIALDFPDVNFVVPHFGCTHMGDLLQLCWTRPNVYVDTSGSNQWIRWMPYQLTLEDVIRKFLETVGPSRIIFATDSSWLPRGFSLPYLEEQHRILRFLNVREDDLKAIFHDTGARLLGLRT
ncbi:MAG: amidohydrolase family protein [Sphaerochaeta sp.]|jgi:predicted TIM-barrel fold metal-dependent hydrolase|uniref:amidohydrolase family protein n=1 Tax=Sphaerochaeta sp. TaxID=1972642 RepID=UPI002FCC24EB